MTAERAQTGNGREATITPARPNGGKGQKYTEAEENQGPGRRGKIDMSDALRSRGSLIKDTRPDSFFPCLAACLALPLPPDLPPGIVYCLDSSVVVQPFARLGQGD